MRSDKSTLAIVAYPFRTCNLTIYNQTKIHLTTCLSSYIYIYTHAYINIKKTRTHSRERRCCRLSEKAQRPEKSWSHKSLTALSYTGQKKSFKFELKWIDFFSRIDQPSLSSQAPIWLFNNVSLFIGRLTHPFNALNRFPLCPPSKSLCLIKVLPKITY